MAFDRHAAFRQRREKLIQDLGSETIADAILAEEARQRIISSEESLRQAGNALYESIRDGLRKNETGAIPAPVTELSKPSPSVAILGANARHAKNRSGKAEFLAWYSENRSSFASKNAAASAGAKLFPFEVATLRGWLKGA